MRHPGMPALLVAYYGSTLVRWLFLLPASEGNCSAGILATHTIERPSGDRKHLHLVPHVQALHWTGRGDPANHNGQPVYASSSQCWGSEQRPADGRWMQHPWMPSAASIDSMPASRQQDYGAYPQRPAWSGQPPSQEQRRQPHYGQQPHAWAGYNGLQASALLTACLFYP